MVVFNLGEMMRLFDKISMRQYVAYYREVEGVEYSYSCLALIIMTNMTTDEQDKLAERVIAWMEPKNTQDIQV